MNRACFIKYTNLHGKNYRAIMIAFRSIQAILLGLILLFVTNCKDDEDATSTAADLPFITTAYVSNLTDTSACCVGIINNKDKVTIKAKGVCWSATNQKPTLSDNVVTVENEEDSYKAFIDNLNLKDTYYVCAYATDASAVTSYGKVLSFTMPDTMSDIDKNVYRIIKIGDQVWMAENLKVTRYRNGDTIPYYQTKATWANKDTGSYGFLNDKVKNIVGYGLLYNYAVVNDERNIAPAGWHVPTDLEWQTLINHLGGQMVAGGILKDSSNLKVTWNSPNKSATNEISFTAIPAGFRNYDGTYAGMGTSAVWWSSTEADTYTAWTRSLGNNYGSVSRLTFNKRAGFSIRCVKD